MALIPQVRAFFRQGYSSFPFVIVILRMWKGRYSDITKLYSSVISAFKYLCHTPSVMEMAGWAQLVGAGAVGLTAGLTIALVLLKQPAQQSKGMSFPLYLWLYI